MSSLILTQATGLQISPAPHGRRRQRRKRKGRKNLSVNDRGRSLPENVGREVREMRRSLKRYGHPNFYKYLDEMAETHSRKNHDYADQKNPLSNFYDVANMTNLTPEQVILVFLCTKIVRIKQLLTKKNLVKGEGITDSCMDLSVYGILLRLILEDKK